MDGTSNENYEATALDDTIAIEGQSSENAEGGDEPKKYEQLYDWKDITSEFFGAVKGSKHNLYQK